MNSSFKIEISKLDKPNTLLCVLTGALELKSTMELETVLEQVLEKGEQKVIIDLKQVSYINSQGLNAILKLQRQLSQHGGGVIIVGPPKRLLNVIDLTGFDQAVHVYDNLAQAYLNDELFYQP